MQVVLLYVPLDVFVVMFINPYNGRFIVTLTPVAFIGPLFITVILYEMFFPSSIGL